MEKTIQRKENTTRNVVDKTPCLKHGGVHQKGEVL
jgi:hypothetical protein